MRRRDNNGEEDEREITENGKFDTERERGRRLRGQMQTMNKYSCSPTERLQCAKFPAFCNVSGRYQCRTERGRNENIYKPEE